MKVNFRIAGEPYEYVEVEMDLSDDVIDDLGKIAGTRDALKRALAPKPLNELPPKEWDAFIEKLLLGENNHTETIEKMSPAQKQTYNVIKRAKSRINSKIQRANLEHDREDWQGGGPGKGEGGDWSGQD